MSRSWYVLVIAGLTLLTACQPQEILLEVTRIVETETTSENELIEVTRVVPQTIEQEATRLVTEEVMVEVEVTRSPLGTETRPVQLLFSPTFDPAVIDQRGLSHRHAACCAPPAGRSADRCRPCE